MKYLNNIIYSHSIIIIAIFLAFTISVIFGIDKYDFYQARIFIYSSSMFLILFPVLGSVQHMYDEFRFGGHNYKNGPLAILLIILVSLYLNHNLIIDGLLHMGGVACILVKITRLRMFTDTKHVSFSCETLKKIRNSKYLLWNFISKDAFDYFYNYENPDILYRDCIIGIEVTYNGKKYDKKEVLDIEKTIEKSIFDISKDDFSVYEMYKI